MREEGTVGGGGGGGECRRQGCIHRIGSKKDGEEGNVNEVTYLLISNELRLRVFNENVRVLFLPACGCVHLMGGGIKEV